MEPEKTAITVGKYEITIVDVRVHVLERYGRDDAESGCLLWTGPLDKDGYGLASVDSRSVRAHRLSYETRVGPIPEGLQLDHTCEVRSCIRPEHLEPVTNFENTVRRYIRRGMTREEAEKVAAEDLDRMAAVRDIWRYARAKAAESGIRKGSVVREGKTPRLWKVVGIHAPEIGAAVMVDIRPADKPTPRRVVRLTRLEVADAKPSAEA